MPPNRQPIDGRVVVADGDEIGMGAARAVVELVDPERSTEVWPDTLTASRNKPLKS